MTLSNNVGSLERKHDETIAAALIEAQNAADYYNSPIGAERRRDFYPKFSFALDRLLVYRDNADALEYLNRTVLTARRFLASKTQPPTSTKQPLYSEGHRLLELRDPVTFDSLKLAYRKAVKRYHPDVGGTHEEMVAIIDAYDAIYQRLSIDGLVMPHFQNELDARGFMFDALALRFAISIDVYDLGEAKRLFDDIEMQKWLPELWKRAGFDDWLARYCLLLIASDKCEEAQRHFTLLKSNGSNIELTHAPLGVPHAIHDGIVKRVHAALKNRQVSIRPTHMLQLENAVRYALLQGRRADAAAEQLRTQDVATLEVLETIRAYGRSPGFLPLPLDRAINRPRPTAGVVPQPLERQIFAELCGDQKAQFGVAFCSDSEANFVPIYAGTRQHELFRGVVRSEISLDDASAEIAFLGSVVRKNTNVFMSCSRTREALVDLGERLPSEQLERTGHLLRLAPHAGDLRQSYIQDPLIEKSFGYRRQLKADHHYLQLLQLPLTQLRRLEVAFAGESGVYIPFPRDAAT